MLITMRGAGRRCTWHAHQGGERPEGASCCSLCLVCGLWFRFKRRLLCVMTSIIPSSVASSKLQNLKKAGRKKGLSSESAGRARLKYLPRSHMWLAVGTLVATIALAEGTMHLIYLPKRHMGITNTEKNASDADKRIMRYLLDTVICLSSINANKFLVSSII